MARPTPCGTCSKPLLDARNEWLWDVFNSIATQSRSAGMGGFTGFDYTALPFILEAKEVPKCMWSMVLRNIELLTPIALKHWGAKQDS